MASKERAFTFTENNGVYTIQSYGAIVSSYKYEYDVCNNLSKLTCSVLSSTWNTVYTYDNDNRPKTTTLNSGKVITNTYDAIGRLSKRTIGLSTPYETRFEYHLNGSNRTPLLHKYYNGSDDPFVYNYDDNGNITSITQGSTSITYKYDVANRLTRENNSILNQTITYKYDKYGNIQSKKTYAYSTGDLTNATYTEIEYEYETDGWNDQLVSYNDQAIEYDEMGNPTTYRGYTFGWRGKQLTSASNGTNSLTFEYNEDGLRQRKTCNNVTTDYYYNGSVLIGMQRGTSKFLFSYDAGGNVVSVNYNGTEYYYLRNAQGDIVKLIDANGTPVVKYTYDTWGKKVTTTGTLAGTLGLFRPFRYRGYVYDWETGFYYLQSRYYDPTVGRFISADVLLSTGQGVLGHNCYAYCLDNPVNMVDVLGLQPVYIEDEEDDESSSEDPNNQENKLEEYKKWRGRYNSLLYRLSKSKGRGRDSGLRDKSIEEIKELYKNSRGLEKLRYQKELKNRESKNTNKRKNQKREKNHMVYDPADVPLEVMVYEGQNSNTSYNLSGGTGLAVGVGVGGTLLICWGIGLAMCCGGGNHNTCLQNLK